MKTFILVRHGQSETNVQKVFTGQINAPLTAVGREQARLTAQYLDKYRVEKIYASSLQRAVETAGVIASRQGCPVEQCDALMEINSGKWQGLTFEEIAEKFPQTYQVWRSDLGNAAPEGGRLAPSCTTGLRASLKNCWIRRRIQFALSATQYPLG